MKSLNSLALLALLLAACGGNDPVADEPSNIVGNLDNAEIETLPADESDASSSAELATGVDTTGSAEGPIPVALQGRWGMTPQDCTSTRGDAKGLITISGDGMKFYEATARPSADAQASADSISGNFDFTGEGQRWTRHQVVEIQKGKLVRTQSDPMESYTYVRCR